MPFFFVTQIRIWGLYLQQKPKILLTWNKHVWLCGPVNSFTNWLLNFTRFWHNQIWRHKETECVRYIYFGIRATIRTVAFGGKQRIHQSVDVHTLFVEKYELSWQQAETRTVQGVLSSSHQRLADTLIKTSPLGGILNERTYEGMSTSWKVQDLLSGCQVGFPVPLNCTDSQVLKVTRSHLSF